VGGKETASEIDKALVAVQKTKRIQNVAPFICNPQEVVEYNGIRYLNINTRRMMLPAEEDGPFPWLAEFFEKSWDPAVDVNGVSQADYCLAWLKRFWESGLQGCLASGQIMFIAGDSGHGKTFFSNFIMGCIAGGFSNASEYLLGGSSFNKELGEVAVWAVDDGNAALDNGTRKKFSASIKGLVANPSVSYQPKYLDSSVLPWQGRLIVTCNTDPESLSIVPTTDNSIVDKLMLLKFGAWKPSFPANAIIEARVRGELPFFLRWLAAWGPPASLQGDSRYGVKSFLHPELLGHSRELSAFSHLIDDLNSLRKDEVFIPKGESRWEGSAGDLARAGKDFFPIRASATQLGVWLSQIHKEGITPWLTRRAGKNNRTEWSIWKNDPVAL